MRTKIGKKAFPLDNSYSVTINTNTNPYLAGYYNQNTNPAKEVIIVSKPYKLKIPGYGCEERKLEFVTVFYDGKCHIVLNRFRKIK